MYDFEAFMARVDTQTEKIFGLTGILERMDLMPTGVFLGRSVYLIPPNYQKYIA
jgi:hypothetical protein